jgi:ribosomal protein S18 acetylase RimI-like enzyme
MGSHGAGDRCGPAEPDVSLPAKQAVEANLLEFFRHFARHRPSGRIEELDGVSIASCGIDFHMFNAAFFSTPVTAAEGELERRIDLAAGRLGWQGGRWAFWACEDRLDKAIIGKAAKAFASRALFLTLRHPGMASESLKPPVRPLPEMEIRPVEDRQSRLALTHINSVAFRIPFEWCLELYDAEQIWGGNFTGYVGRVNGEAVSTVATLTTAGAVGLYCVATLPGHEHKGYAEAMVRHAAACAQEASGIKRLILQSTAPGLSLYRRMGFGVVTHFAIYSR